MATHSKIFAWEIHGQRSLAGYSPWSCKDSDMTWQLNNNKRNNSKEIWVKARRYLGKARGKHHVRNALGPGETERDTEALSGPGDDCWRPSQKWECEMEPEAWQDGSSQCSQSNGPIWGRTLRLRETDSPSIYMPVPKTQPVSSLHQGTDPHFSLTILDNIWRHRAQDPGSPQTEVEGNGHFHRVGISLNSNTDHYF